MSAFTILPSNALAEEYRATGVWRDSGPVGDLRRWRDESPEATAIWAYRAGAPPKQISYAEYAHVVERFAGALYELGVRPGQVVAVQLPNWWQAGGLILAAARLDAVLVPIMTTIRPRELERVLHRVGASVCVTVDRWAGFDHAVALRDMAPRLPALRHRVIVGQSAGQDEIDFTSFFEDTPWEQRHLVALDDAREDPDRVALVLFTSGTSGEPKGVLHTSNTMYSSTANWAGVERITPPDTVFCPHALTHFAGQFSLLLPLLTGACTVLLDTWSGESGLALLAETDTTFFLGAPPFFYDLIAAAERKSQALPALRLLASGATTIPRQLVTDVPSLFGVPLRATWGMTEVGIAARTRSDDPPDWAAHSDGRFGTSVEFDLRSDSEITRDQPARLFARGGGVCLATLGRDTGELTVTAEHDDGWYDSGDLAIPDGRGGIRLMGRASDRIGGRGMIPVNDVEAELLDHPGVADVALVGYPDGQGGELACAVVSAATSPPATLDELRKHLIDQGMTDWYLPSRLEYVPTLPRNANGKVRKELLRRWLQGEGISAVAWGSACS